MTAGQRIMSNETRSEPIDSPESLPKKKQQVGRGLPSWLEGGKLVMIFGTQGPSNAMRSSEEAKTEIKTNSSNCCDPTDEGTDHTAPGASAEYSIDFKSVLE